MLQAILCRSLLARLPRQHFGFRMRKAVGCGGTRLVGVMVYVFVDNGLRARAICARDWEYRAVVVEDWIVGSAGALVYEVACMIADLRRVSTTYQGNHILNRDHP